MTFGTKGETIQPWLSYLLGVLRQQAVEAGARTSARPEFAAQPESVVVELVPLLVALETMLPVASRLWSTGSLCEQSRL